MKWVGVWACLLVGSLYADGLHCDISQRSLDLDEHLTVRLEAVVPEGYRWEPLSLQAGLDLLGEESGFFTLVSEGYERVEGREVVTLTLEPWRSGEALIRFLPVRLISDIGPPIELYSSVFSVSVNSLPPTEEQVSPSPLLPLRDRPVLALNEGNRQRLEQDEEHRQVVLDAADASSRHRRYLLWLMVILVASGLVVILARRVRWQPPEPPPRDPRAVALLALEELVAKGLPEKCIFDLFYVELTAIVRRFVEDCYKIRAPEQTTEEFLSEASRHPAFDAKTKSSLREFLSLADLVKFARHHPTLEQCIETLDAARLFVS